MYLVTEKMKVMLFSAKMFFMIESILTLIRMTKDEKVLAIFKGLLL